MHANQHQHITPIFVLVIIKQHWLQIQHKESYLPLCETMMIELWRTHTSPWIQPSYNSNRNTSINHIMSICASRGTTIAKPRWCVSFSWLNYHCPLVYAGVHDMCRIINLGIPILRPKFMENVKEIRDFMWENLDEKNHRIRELFYYNQGKYNEAVQWVGQILITLFIV